MLFNVSQKLSETDQINRVKSVTVYIKNMVRLWQTPIFLLISSCKLDTFCVNIITGDRGGRSTWAILSIKYWILVTWVTCFLWDLGQLINLLSVYRCYTLTKCINEIYCNYRTSKKGKTKTNNCFAKVLLSLLSSFILKIISTCLNKIYDQKHNMRPCGLRYEQLSESRRIALIGFINSKTSSELLFLKTGSGR